MANKSRKLNCVSFNCLGYKSSSAFVDNLCKKYDICFLCEHWLRPCEITPIQSLLKDKCLWSSFKSSIDPEAASVGRPYGGVGFVCKESSDLSYQVLDVNSDRICAIQVISSHSVILSCIGVYLPFNNGSTEQTELYIETLDILQVLLNTYGDISPLMISGDFNTTLPQSAQLAHNWYRKHPFSKQSFLLYEFLSSNDLCVANFDFKQSVNYTYFKGKMKSYIDHCIVSRQLSDCVSNCSIVFDNEDCTSDHFPVEVSINVHVRQPQDVDDAGKPCQNVFPRANWNDRHFCEVYMENISKVANDIVPPVNHDVFNTDTDVQSYIDKYYGKIANAMHIATEKSINTVKQHHTDKKPKHWWNSDCTFSRNRHRFWFALWCSCGRPREGAVYDAYKYSKHMFRKKCRSAVNNVFNENFKHCDTLLKQKRMRSFWNKIKKGKSSHTANFNSISLPCLEKHFKEKFAYNVDVESEFILQSRTRVNDKLKNCNSSYDNFVFTEHLLRKYIAALKPGCSPGSDGVMSEHIINSSHSNLVYHLCNIFTACFKYGTVPTCFTNGLLVPILKKTTLDPSVPKNYRPVIVSNILSKLVEMYIIDDCNNFEASDYQFGFVHNRGTNTAISLAHDVASYFNFSGSSVFMCGLDAEGAFDAIPHPVLFCKAMDYIDDMNWKLLYNWYDNISVQVKWNGLGNVINVCKGTRQGGLTSPLLFNMFYKDLVDEIAAHDGGISISSERFNIFCYADDILLASTTVTGLQTLISCAVNYISRHGLRFNPSKSKCVIYGKNPFTVTPKWFIDNCELQLVENIEYLGTYLGNGCGNEHVNHRTSSCRKSFFSLQGAGLCNYGLNVDTALYVFKATCRSVILYGCDAIYLSNVQRNALDKLQAKLVKCLVGLGPKYRTSPLLNALKIHSISKVIDVNNISLLHNIMKTNSAARKFNLIMLKKNCSCPRLLVNRVQKLSNDQTFNLINIITSRPHGNQVKSNMLKNIKDGENGMIDTIRLLLKKKSDINISLLRLMLKAF
jgi:exonuclease III